MALAGGYIGHLGDYWTGAAQAIMPYVVGGGEDLSNSKPVGRWCWSISDVVVLWSVNPLNTLKIAWNASDEQGLSSSALRDSGKKPICIDPMRSETVDFFGDKNGVGGTAHGHRCALMLGIAHTLVENGWHAAKRF